MKEKTNNELDHPINKFKVFGALDYTIDQIAIVMDATPMEKALLEERLSDPLDEIAIAYSEGKFKGKASTEVALLELAWEGEVDAVEAFAELSKTRKVNALKQELFGV